MQDEVPIHDENAHRAGVRRITGYTAPLVLGTPSNSHFRSYFLEYDRAGARIRHLKFDRDGKVIRQWFYDDRSRLSQEVTYDARGDIDYRLDVLQEVQGWTEKRMYSRQDHVQYRVVADRNTSGRLLRTNHIDSAGQVIRVDSYNYDQLGLLVCVTAGQLGERTYEYDQRQKLKKRTNNMPGMSMYGDIDEFSHDDQDLLIRMEHLHLSVTTFEFAR